MSFSVDRVCNAGSVTLLPIIPYYIIQLRLWVGVYDVKCTYILASVHSHVELGLTHVGKAAARIVELMGADAEVEHYAVRAVNTVGGEQGAHIEKITVYSSKFRVIAKPFACFFDSLVVAVYAEKPAPIGKKREYSRAVTAAAESAVNKNAAALGL